MHFDRAIVQDSGGNHLVAQKPSDFALRDNRFPIIDTSLTARLLGASLENRDT
jgi:hypothetical protein